jgi:signal transduction histidine kinase
VRAIIEKVVVTLDRIAAERGLTWTIDAREDVTFIGDENDLLELVGNLADNAAKWATSHVRVSALQAAGGTLVITIADDGPGVPDGAHDDTLVRGRRLDEATEGSGLGLSIVAKIVDAYGGTLRISQSEAGGLTVTLRFDNRRIDAS